VLFGFVWPRVIAVGTWTEFYEKLLAKEDVDGLQRKELSLVMAKDDWFFRSYAEMNKVKQGELSLLKFVKEYGIRADVDYELTCPRWYEDKVALMKKIKKAKNSENNNEVVGCSSYSKYFEIVREMYKIRTETKKETLRFIGALRAELLKRGRLEKISVKSKKVKKEVRVAKNGSGMGVSEGSVSGKVKVYGVGKDVILSNAIGVFPNASPEYSIFYPHCKGIIFLRGGMTSHGVIVAREYGIPALVDAAAECLKRGERVVINGSSGEWQVVKK